MRALLGATLLAGGVAISSPSIAQDLAALPAQQAMRLVFLEQDGLSPTAREMLRTIAVGPGRTVELKGAPANVEAVRRQLIADGIAPGSIVVRPGASKALPALPGSMQGLMPHPEQRSVEIRVM